MKPDPIELSRAESRVSSTVLIVGAIGEFGARVLDNTTGVWWPSAALLGCFLVFVTGFTVHLRRNETSTMFVVYVLAIPIALLISFLVFGQDLPLAVRLGVLPFAMVWGLVFWVVRRPEHGA